MKPLATAYAVLDTIDGKSTIDLASPDVNNSVLAIYEKHKHAQAHPSFNGRKIVKVTITPVE